jgi:hypothetical protein
MFWRSEEAAKVRQPIDDAVVHEAVAHVISPR